MELFLNIFWLLLALTGAGLWGARWSRTVPSRARGAEVFRSAVGLVCVLVLLFFAISLTDDLNMVPAVAEEARSSRRTLQIWKGSQTDPDPEKHSAAYDTAVLLALFAPHNALISRLVTTDAGSPRAAAHQPLQGRAPPRFASHSL